MESFTSISLVRHGHVHNPGEVYYGRLLGFPLSEKGRRQARAAMEFLREKPLVAAYTSPRLRARETAQIIIAPHRNLLLSTSELLDEVYTPFDGQPASEVDARGWDVYSGTDPMYEQPQDVLGRAQRFVWEVRLGHRGQAITAITHGDIIAFLMLWAQGIPPTVKNKQALYNEYLAPASVTTFIFQTTTENERPQIEYVNPFHENIKTVNPEVKRG